MTDQHQAATSPEPASTDTVAQPAEPQYNAPFNVNISFPESIVIKMVDASALNDYEMGLFASTILFGGCIGFFVAWLQSTTTSDAKAFGPMALILALLAVAALMWALKKRSRMTARSRSFRLRTSTVEEVRE